MSRRALGIFVSLIAFVAVNPPALAGESGARSGGQKQAAGKSSSVSNKRVSSQQASKKKKAVSARKKSASRHARSQTAKRSPRLARAPARKAASGLSAGELAGLHLTPDPLSLKSSVALVVDQRSAEVLFEKNADVALPIASLTKLMTALVVVEARQDLDEMLEITADDIDRLKNSGSRLRVGARMTRGEMLHLALMSSENRAASALARHYPGGTPGFVAAMNARAASLGMQESHFADSTGLSSHNRASAHDLSKLALAAYRHPLIRDYSTQASHAVKAGGYQLQYKNSNRLVNHPDWDIGLQKTGYIAEAGRCLIMQTRVEGRPVVMVFLDSRGKDSRLGDAGRIRKWLENAPRQPATQMSARRS